MHHWKILRSVDASKENVYLSFSSNCIAGKDGGNNTNDCNENLPNRMSFLVINSTAQHDSRPSDSMPTWDADAVPAVKVVGLARKLWTGLQKEIAFRRMIWAGQFNCITNQRFVDFRGRCCE